MTVVASADDVIRLSGHCASEDAEVLLELLLAAPQSIVDWRECLSAHTAVVQVLMAARRRLQGPPAGASLRRWVASTL